MSDIHKCVLDAGSNYNDIILSEMHLMSNQVYFITQTNVRLLLIIDSINIINTYKKHEMNV